MIAEEAVEFAPADLTRPARHRRIQRRRTKGWKAPKGAVYVGRPTKWGNPFVAAVIPGWATDSRQYAVNDYQRWLDLPLDLGSHQGKPLAGRPTYDEIRRELGGKDLMCYCPLAQPCHADVLLAIANSPASPSSNGSRA